MKRGLALLMSPLALVAVLAAAEVAVPPPLSGWEGWVMHGSEYRRCPFLSTRDPEGAGAYRCAWPGRLQLDVDGRGGRFAQRWQVYSDSWVVLPGNLENWPRDVRANGAAAPVVEREGRPQLYLRAGDHAIGGRFEWAVRPESLDIAMQSGLVDLTVDGQRVSQPERAGGAISLGKAARAEQAAALEVQVYRLVSDDIPTRLDTWIRLQVAGDGREELLARALPEGFTPTALTGDLPARLDADGRLRVQVRPGSHVLRLAARADTGTPSLRRPAVAQGKSGAWAKAEIWSFAGIDRLRVAAATGAESVDPAQVDVPPEWRQLPAFRMEADTTLTVDETQRGLSAADDNRLTLNRQLWLDFDRGGYTARDQVGGKLRQTWRLDMAPPFRLESARIGADNLLVTESPGSANRGVELRSPQLHLDALSRLEQRGGAQPATGWASRFESVGGELNLPPGFLLLAALGPDEASGTWWSGWSFWSLFWIVIVAFLSYRLAGLPAGLVALGGLVLMYQEWPPMIWLWANLLVVMGLASAVPEGRLQRFLNGYRLLAAGMLVVALLSFAWSQVRVALHPQLQSGGFEVVTDGVRLELPKGPEPMFNAREAAADAAAAAADAPATADAPAELDIAGGEARVNDAAPPEVSPMLPSSVRESRVMKSSPYGGDVSGLNAYQTVQRYAAGTALQTGPGIPAWRYQQYRYAWSGPVEPTDTVRFLIIGPTLLALWRFIGVALLVLWLVRLLQRAWRFDVPLPGGRKLAHGAALILLALGFAPSAEVHAQIPDSELLQELGNRLKARPDCHPSCATLTAASVVVDGDRLVVDLEASAGTSIAVPVPTASDRWQIDAVSIDGGSGYTALREDDGSLWVPLRAGAHRVRLEGRIAPVANLQLGFPSVPRTVKVSASGWDVAGVTEGRMLSSAIELTRQRGAAASGQRNATLERGAEFPTFVRVIRDVALDLDWTVTTRVLRVAPERASIAVEIPLLAGESVLTPGVEVRGGRTVLAGIPAGTGMTTWQSGLARRDALRLVAPAAAERVEIWQFSVNPQWHAEFDGLPAVLPDDIDAPNWAYTFYPRPGEALNVKLTRPKAAQGSTLAIDSARQWVRFGVRSSDAGVAFRYRSTQGGRHVIDLPANVAVEEVQQDGQPLQVRPEKGKLSIGLLPGKHLVEVRWRAPRGAALRSALEPANLNTPASNLTSTISTPQDRWTLLAPSGGAGVGPAILYWSELVAFLLTAWVLGLWKHSPLRRHEWFLLGIGLSTMSAAVFAVVILWVLAMSWRSTWQAAVPRGQFNLVQVVLAIATVTAIVSLFGSGINFGLLSTPDMGIAGPGSYDGNLTWFQDRTVDVLPAPAVISVPLWVYKVLIIAWALWVAAATVRWLKWAWQSWNAGGYWRGVDGVQAETI